MRRDILLTAKAVGYFACTTMYIALGVVLKPFNWLHKTIRKGAEACSDFDQEMTIVNK